MTEPVRPSPPSDLDLVADALGDPTRRAVFTHLCQASAPLTAAEVGATFGVHRTVARAHLERLVEHGLLTADFRRSPGEGGRPPKVYSRSKHRLELQVPMRQYELLSALLLKTLEQFGPAADLLVDQMGFAFGQGLADTEGAGLEDRLEPLVRSGARCAATAHDGGVRVELCDCLFREVAQQRPGLICTLDRAIVAGLLSADGDTYMLREARRRSPEDDRCLLTFFPTDGPIDGRRQALLAAPLSDPTIDHPSGGEERA